MNRENNATRHEYKDMQWVDACYYSNNTIPFEQYCHSSVYPLINRQFYVALTHITLSVLLRAISLPIMRLRTLSRCGMLACCQNLKNASLFPIQITVCHPLTIKATITRVSSDDPICNERYICLKFTNGGLKSVLHGFAGYFDTVLYGDVVLSEWVYVCVQVDMTAV